MYFSKDTGGTVSKKVQVPHIKESQLGADKKPVDILKEHIARGEIEIEAYKDKKQLLSKNS